ncbi:Conserved protein [Lacticaseibacillus rhamnosus Lc 705]|nr:Conserved protein [Lacticaseibacillus rhamnosus Lc 705]
MTRSLAQGSARKDLGRNGQAQAITPKAAYTPIPNRASSRSHKKSAIRFSDRTFCILCAGNDNGVGSIFCLVINGLRTVIIRLND